MSVRVNGKTTTHREVCVGAWPLGLERVLDAALRYIERGDPRPLLLGGPRGVGKSTCALALAERLARPLAVYDVAVPGLRLGQREGLRELPLIPRCLGLPSWASSAAPPIIVIEHADRLAGGLTGNAMASLVAMGTERFPQALEHYFGVGFAADQTVFIFTTRANVEPSLKATLLVLECGGYFLPQKVTIATRLFQDAGRHLPSTAVRRLVQGCSRAAGVAEVTEFIGNTQALTDAELEAMDIAATTVRPTSSLLERFAVPLPGQVAAMISTREGGIHLIVETCFGAVGRGNLTVLGNAGDVLVASAKIAFQVVNTVLNESERLGASAGRAVLINFPGNSGHWRDSQSLGLAIGLALYGLAIGRSARPGLAVTGELSLTGQVLPVLGCRSRLMAAERDEIECAIFPDGNSGAVNAALEDLSERPRVAFVKTFPEALALSFAPGADLR